MMTFVWVFIRLAILVLILIPVCVTDIRERRIANAWCVALLVAGAALAVLPALPGPLRSGTDLRLLLTSCGTGFLCSSGTGLCCRAVAKEGFGLGDVKLLAGLGAFLGLWLFLRAMALTGVLTLAAAVWMLLIRRAKRTDTLPFAPFLAAGAVLSQAMELWAKGGAA